jgi:hypothetical protein
MRIQQLKLIINKVIKAQNYILPVRYIFLNCYAGTCSRLRTGKGVDLAVLSGLLPDLNSI